MFRISRLAELLKHVPRSVFDREVQRLQADKYRKSFSCWQQLVSMVYAQLSAASSLRVLHSSFNAHSAHHYHLGCSAIRRSTLADANTSVDQRVFSATAEALMQQLQRSVRTDAQEFLRLIDSTPISLKGRGFDEWTRKSRTGRTQGVKLHVMFGLPEQAPLAQLISAPNLNDLTYAQDLALEPGVIYVFDKAYYDYAWWWRITRSGAKFVTRFKRNAKLQILSERAIARSAQGIILKDQTVRLSTRSHGRRSNPYVRPLRRIEVARAGKEPLILVTNDMKSSAAKIAERYRARWQIELFFKWIKQHLRIKSFLGRSENAVRIQILTALIAYLLAALHAKAHNVKTTLWLHLSELRASLFQRPELELQRHRKWRAQREWFEQVQSALPL
jgi:putative transposase